MTEDHYYLMKWGLGVGINNKAELLASYMILIFAHDKGLLHLQIFGDSILVINSLNNAQRCHNIQLTPILEEVAHIRSIFNLITFRHIFRERNAVADHCSKEAAGPFRPNGAFHFYHRPFIKAPQIAID